MPRILQCITVMALLPMVGCTQLAPRDAMLDSLRLPAIPAAIQTYIDRGQLPGGAFLIERGDSRFATGVGRQTFAPDSAPITPDTIFDAASLTKAVVTAPAMMQLIDAGKVSLDDPLMRHLPECIGGGKEAITLRHLLTHTSGLNTGLPALPAWTGQAEALRRACAQVVTHAPGTFFRYSDINFILLGFVIEHASGMSLDTYAQLRIFAPLGMTRTRYLPTPHFSAAEIAPTQRTGNEPAKSIHRDLSANHELRGVVHDPTARFMGGVAGHAGLFTTGNDLARYARMLQNDGEWMAETGTVRILSPEAVRLMRTVQTPDAAHYRRSAGWDIDSPFSRPRGKHFPVGSFGHTGFTGCILWIDPFSKTFFVFLSNRVYPNDKGNILALYSELGTLAAQAVAGFDFTLVDGALTPRPPLPAPQQP